eukprot:CAMPEP_0182928010 /NCGR_PEP_ID=MMETSP0105_2-20130417/14942_1 /TAXON_ID=81532 ORGANISM="Acanthoeca-like sp., Strain 10tr" /NCGR_SAMPLE_ID=MMETSP0105_2 /ASSEMBLY_ACC=CAM_ASM_000205 /LENGTH=242 /DNA_ID=CAMNT_0025065997 /DNA_START=31 /DNA_END=759 /DNA_ORIENTATION=-
MADLVAAAAGRAAPPDLEAAQIRKDKKEAVRLARLKMKANARGAAPPPPSKKGGAPPPTIAPAAGGEAPKVEKYRAVEDFKGEVEFQKGATLFVLGAPDADGNVMAVTGGKSGSVPSKVLVPITDALLAKEREEKEKAAEEDRKAKEAVLEKAKAAIEAEERAKLDALDDKARQLAVADSGDAGASEEDKLAAAARAAAEAKIKEENDALLEEENRLKAEAARLEELMRQLDMSDDDDDDEM